MRTVAFCLLAIALFVPNASAAPTTVTYVVGAHTPAPAEYGVICGGNEQAKVGGACLMTPTDASDITVTVKDLTGAPVSFMWQGARAREGSVGDVACGQYGYGVGTAHVELVAPCERISIWPDLGSVAGTITVS